MGSPLTDVPFSRFFSESRLLKAGLIFNVGYYLAVVLTFVALRITGQIGSTIYQMDFQVFFAASQMLSVAPADLYSVASNGLPYRYLPAFAMVVQAFQWVPLDIAYLTWISLMMLANWANLKLAYHLCQLCGASLTTKNLEKTLFILFIAPQHVVNLILGQVSQLAIFLILYSLVILHSGADDSFRQFFVASLLVGVAAHLKPFAILLVPFLVPVERHRRYLIRVPLKPLAAVVAGVGLAMLPSAMFFITYPDSFWGFVDVTANGRLGYHHSTSLVTLIGALVPQLRNILLAHTTLLIPTVAMFAVSYARFISTPNTYKSYIMHFSEVVFIVLIIYPESWFLFLAILYSLLGPSMIMLYGPESMMDKKPHLDALWSLSNNVMAFFWVGVVIHYLVLGYDPVVPVCVVIMYVLYQHVLFRRFRIQKVGLTHQCDHGNGQDRPEHKNL